MFAITDLMLLFESEGMVAQYYIPNIEEVMDMIKKIFSDLFQIQIEEIYLLLILV